MTIDSILSWLIEASVVLGLIAILVFLVRAAVRRRVAAGWIYASWIAVPVALLASLAPSGLLELPLAQPAPWLLPVWLLGALGFLAAHVAAQLRFERAVVGRARAPEGRELVEIERAAAGAGLDPARDFRISAAIEGPVACGVVRPVVLLPEAFFDDFSTDERRVMVLHEAEHLRAGHIAHRLAARLIRDLFWFHPLAWLAERAFIADQELACDQAALRRDVAIRPRTYAQTLLKAAQRIARPSGAPAGSVPLIAAQDLRQRADMLGRHAAIGRTSGAGALVLGALAAAAVLTGLALRSGADRAPALAEAPRSPAGPTGTPSQPAAGASVDALTAPDVRRTSLPPEPAPRADDEPVTLTIYVGDRTPRVFSPEVGELVVRAQEKLSASPPDNDGAREDLSRALAMPLTPYELGVVLYMRGGVKYRLGDVDGAIADWTRALAEGDLGPQEQLSVLYNVGQLHLSEGRYAQAVAIFEQWIAMGGEPNDGVYLNMTAAQLELGDLAGALKSALKAYELASPRQRRHYDMLDHLYGVLGMTEQQRALLSEWPPELRDEAIERRRRELGLAP